MKNILNIEIRLNYKEYFYSENEDCFELVVDEKYFIEVLSIQITFIIHFILKNQKRIIDKYFPFNSTLKYYI